MTKIARTLEFEIPDSFIEEIIIDQAGYGIGYWASAGVIDSDERTYTITDHEGDESVLTYDEIAASFVDLALGLNQARSDLVGYAAEALRELAAGEKYPGGDIDADVADIIIQIAAHGDIIYG